jgi:glycosyltransferase involved in cell wall biosynthesis
MRLARRIRRAAGVDPAVRAMTREARQLRRSEAFDVVLSSGKQTLSVLDELSGLPLVVDVTDATSIRLAGAARHADPLHRVRLLAEARAMRRIESSLLGRADELVFASRRDCDALLAGSAGVTAPASVIPNGVDLGYWRRRTDQRGQANVVFTGGMHYPPNTDAALTLIRSIMPLVWRQEPDARLKIVGRDPTPELVQAGRGDPRVVVTGFVDDVRPFLEDATVFAAPLRFGAGIQNKVLEAMAFQLPVVASSIAADGLRVDATVSLPVTVADDPERFGGHLAAELRAARSDATPRAETRAYVAAQFEWTTSGRRLGEVIERAARSSGRT